MVVVVVVVVVVGIRVGAVLFSFCALGRGGW